MTNVTRDTTLDMLRGATMLYMIFACHGLCWFNFVPANSTFFSIVLFVEMPVIFYVSGAAVKLASRKTFGQYVKSRLLRVLLPYVVWAVITACVMLLVGDLRRDWVNLAACRNLESIPFAWHTWFIYPYLIIAILGYPLFGFYQKWGHRFVLIYAIAIAGVVALMDYLGLLRQSEIIRPVLAYSVFFVTGYTYKDGLSVKANLIVWLFLVALFAGLVLSGTYTFITQTNKFPPNLAYLCYGGISVMTFSLLLSMQPSPRQEKSDTHSFLPAILRFASDYCFDLYLYQNFAMWIYSIIKDHYFRAYPIWAQYLLGVIIAAALLFPMALVMNKVNHGLSGLLTKRSIHKQ